MKPRSRGLRSWEPSTSKIAAARHYSWIVLVGSMFAEIRNSSEQPLYTRIQHWKTLSHPDTGLLQQKQSYRLPLQAEYWPHADHLPPQTSDPMSHAVSESGTMEGGRGAGDPSNKYPKEGTGARAWHNGESWIYWWYETKEDATGLMENCFRCEIGDPEKPARYWNHPHSRLL